MSNDGDDIMSAFFWIIALLVFGVGGYIWSARQCETICTAQHAQANYLACNGCWCRKDGDLYNPADSR